MSKIDDFKKELECLINKYSLENGSNTPDFILAEYLTNCLKNFNDVLKAKDKFYRQAQKGTIYYELYDKFDKHIPNSICHELSNEICQGCPEIETCKKCFPNIENCQVSEFEEYKKSEIDLNTCTKVDSTKIEYDFIKNCGTHENNSEKIVVTTGIPAGVGFTGQSNTVFIKKETTNIAPIESTDIPEITIIEKNPDTLCHDEPTNEICQECPEITNFTKCFPNIENCQVLKFEELNKNTKAESIDNFFNDSSEKAVVCTFCKRNPCNCEDDLPF